MFILNSICSHDLGNCCNDSGLLVFFKTGSSIISIIQIIAPIILLIMATVQLTRLVINPDLKNGLKSLRHKFIAAGIIFFIPIIVDATLLMINPSGNFQITSCLKEAKSFNYENTKYISINENENKHFMLDEGYEKGKPKENKNASSTAKITGKGVGVDVAKYAQSWVGKVGYHFASNEPLANGSYSDCSHFVYHVLNDFGLMDHYVRSIEWEAGHVQGAVRVNSLSDAVPGDVLCWDFGDGTGHVEIYIGNGRSVGCCGSGNTGSTVEHAAGGYTSIWHITAYD